MFFQKRVLAQLSWGLVSPCSLLTCKSSFLFSGSIIFTKASLSSPTPLTVTLSFSRGGLNYRWAYLLTGDIMAETEREAGGDLLIPQAQEMWKMGLWSSWTREGKCGLEFCRQTSAAHLQQVTGMLMQLLTCDHCVVTLFPDKFMWRGSPLTICFPLNLQMHMLQWRYMTAPKCLYCYCATTEK